LILKWYIGITLVFYVVCKNKNKALGLLLLISVLNILITDIGDYLNQETSLSVNLYVFLNSLIMLVSIKKIGHYKTLNTGIIASFIVFNIISYCYINICMEFNCDAFVFGALSYITAFIIENYFRLEKEELAFFQSNNFLFLSAPILFFLGMSFLFCFKSHTINSIKVYRNVSLFTFTTYFVNTIFYGILLLYIYKEKK
jgi:hypothetical protein